MVKMTKTYGRHLMSLSLVICYLALGTLLASCASDEDNTPSLADRNVFIPADDDQSPTAQLRRSFFQQTGSYLLFTDTLLTVENGRAIDGTLVSKTELLDVMGYSLPGDAASDYEYEYIYITDADARREAARLVADYLVPRMGRALPYAYMLVNGITYEDYNGRLVTINKLLGLRAYVISMDNGAAQANPDNYFRQMVGDMVKDQIGRLSTVDMQSFYQFSNDYYMQYKEDFGLKPTRLDEKDVWKYGFFTDIYGEHFPYQDDDLKAWLNAVLTYSREQFETSYGSVPVMLNKYDALRSIIENDLGFILD